MAQTGNFKSYERGNRYQTTHSAFSAGMHFTDAPIPEGAAKVLVNYDIGEDGMSLRPRKGLKAYQVSYTTKKDFYSTEQLVYLDSKVCYQSGTEFTQVLLGKPVSKDFYEVQVWTYGKNKELLNKNNNYAPKIKLNNQHPVGCFINDQYFFFDADSGALYYTVINESHTFYVLQKLETQETSYAQAQQMGFNMLLKEPYTYTDTYVAGATTAMNFQSINAFDDAACTIPAQQELLLNKQYYYRVSYSGAGTVKLVFDWTAADTMEWQELTTIEKFTVGEETPTKIKIPFSSPVSKAIIRCTAYSGEIPLDIIWFSFDYKEQYTKAEVPLNNFSLHTATTMAYWQNRLVVAGVKEDPAYLFMSAPELFEYFPFPHNADYLDEPIMAVQTFLDNLLVFTKSKLYLYTLDPTNGLTRKCIQTNLNIDESDTHLIKIVKNMAYFKSGLYYYMVVPKLNSTTGELTIAPVYRNIKELLDAPDINMRAIIREVYPELENINYYKTHNYLDYESIHNVYMYEIKSGLYINFDLMYNTVKRFWSVYLYESPAEIYIRKADATKPGDMLCLIQIRNATETQEFVTYTPCIQFIEWDVESCKDVLYTTNIQPSTPVSRLTDYNNHQYIDTGYMDINSNYKKRFREVQFRIVNNTSTSLEFATTFYIDGVATNLKYVYTPVVDESTGTLTLTKTLSSNTPKTIVTQGYTRLGVWQLSKNLFPGADIIKTRIPVSGKGYNSQIKIHCDSPQDYTLLDITNVYRPLYLR